MAISESELKYLYSLVEEDLGRGVVGRRFAGVNGVRSYVEKVRAELMVLIDSSPGGGGAVDSVNGQVGVVVLDKTDIGLSNVDNTSDANKPVSTAQGIAIGLKEDAITSGTADQYWRGDKTWQTLPPAGITFIMGYKISTLRL